MQAPTDTREWHRCCGKILSYGVVAGLVVGVSLSAVVVHGRGHQDNGMAIGYLIMLVGLSVVFVGIKRYRDQDLGRVIRFWPAFGLGLGISAVAGVLYVISWEATVASPTWISRTCTANMLIEQERAKGVSAEALARSPRRWRPSRCSTRTRCSGCR
jgi:hypothetical protein